MENREIIICSCYSFEHQAIFYEHDKILFVSFHLKTYHNFFKRLWYGLKYAFGYKSRFGSWDEFIFDSDQKKQLFDYLNKQII